MVIFKIDHATLQASYFSSHDGKSYFFTGNNAVAERCAQ
jgi:YHS domain-containing protein